MDYSALSPEELVWNCLNTQDQAAWLEFVHRFQPLIAATVFRVARQFSETSPSVVDDLVQDAFLKMCKDDARLLREFRSTHPDSIFGFVKVLTANLALDHFKARNSLKRGYGLTLEQEGVPFAREKTRSAPTRAMEDCERRVLLNQIDACLKTFDPSPTLVRDRRIFWLHYRVGLSAVAISELPGINLTVKGIESSLLRMTRMIREKLTTRGRSEDEPGNPTKGVETPDSF